MSFLSPLSSFSFLFSLPPPPSSSNSFFFHFSFFIFLFLVTGYFFFIVSFSSSYLLLSFPIHLNSVPPVILNKRKRSLGDLLGQLLWSANWTRSWDTHRLSPAGACLKITHWLVHLLHTYMNHIYPVETGDCG